MNLLIHRMGRLMLSGLILKRCFWQEYYRYIKGPYAPSGYCLWKRSQSRCTARDSLQFLLVWSKYKPSPNIILWPYQLWTAKYNDRPIGVITLQPRVWGYFVLRLFECLFRLYSYFFRIFSYSCRLFCWLFWLVVNVCSLAEL